MLTIAVAISTLAILLVSLWGGREGTNSETGTISRTTEVVPFPRWNDAVDSGHRSGPRNARVQVVVFQDFECPACRQFESRTIPSLMKDYGDEIAFTFHHWPLSQHRFALPAARAAECAASQGKFTEFAGVTFQHQHQLGLISFDSLAKLAAVVDQPRFSRCLADTARLEKIDLGIELAESAGAVGTPAIAVNGVLIKGAFNRATFDSLVAVR